MPARWNNSLSRACAALWYVRLGSAGKRIRPYRPVDDLSGFAQVNEQRRFRAVQLFAQAVVATQAYRRVFRLSGVILIQDAERSMASIDFIGAGTKQQPGVQ